MKRLRRIRDLLIGRMDSALSDALLGQLAATKEGAWLAMAMIGGEVGRTGAHEQMRTIEHLGDEERRRLVEELRSALVTPIDREDLFRLSRSIDDVLDSLRDFVRESHLYQVPDQIRFTPLLDQVIVGIDALENAVRDLVSSPSAVVHDALEAKKTGGAIRRMYQYRDLPHLLRRADRQRHEGARAGAAPGDRGHRHQRGRGRHRGRRHEALSRSEPECEPERAG